MRRTDLRKARGVEVVLVLAVAAIAIPRSAAAGEEGWYGRVDGGYSIDASLELDAPTPITNEPALEDGAFVSVALGYGLSDHWRLEGELARRDTDVEPATGLDQGGSFGVTTLMFNAYYDLAPGASLQPYVGAGLGVAFAEIDMANDAPLSPVVVDDESTGIAYQVMAGVALPITQTLRIDLGYRYLGGVSVEGEGSAPPIISFPVDAEMADHEVTLGLRWDF